jgi:hypothetical protein
MELAQAHTNSSMTMLYDSENFAVVHVRYDKPIAFRSVSKNGFEIVDKRTNKEVFLQDDWAGAFQSQISAWQLNTPTQSEVEGYLDNLSSFATLPLVLH